MNKNKVLKIVGITYLVIGLALILPLSLTVNAYTGTSPVFMGGSQVKPYAYCIWREGSIYYATNGLTGQVDYSGSNFTEVGEDCIDALPATGGVIRLQAQTYEGSLVVDRDGIIIEGSGIWGFQEEVIPSEAIPIALYGTVIKPLAGKNGIEISNWESGEGVGDFATKLGIQIRDLGIWFDGVSPTGHGITTGTPYNVTTVAGVVIENIKILGNDEDHYGLQLCNFLYSSFKNIDVWGGAMLEIYSNHEELKQGNSYFEQLFNRVAVDFNNTEHGGAFPIFIHKNASIGVGNCWSNLMIFDRIQVNNPVHQTGDNTSIFYDVYIGDLRHTTFTGLNLEGVNDGKVRVGTSKQVTFNNAYLWTLLGNASINVASNNEHITWEDCVLEDILDGNRTDVYRHCQIYGVIDPNTLAQFEELEGQSGWTQLTSGASSLLVNATWIGTKSLVFITMVDANFTDPDEMLKIESVDSANNRFTVKCIDEGSASQDLDFFWIVTGVDYS